MRQQVTRRPFLANTKPYVRPRLYMETIPQQSSRLSKEHEDLQTQHALKTSRVILRDFETKRMLNTGFDSELAAEMEAVGRLRIDGVKADLIPAAAQMIVYAHFKR